MLTLIVCIRFRVLLKPTLHMDLTLLHMALMTRELKFRVLLTVSLNMDLQLFHIVHMTCNELMFMMLLTMSLHMGMELFLMEHMTPSLMVLLRMALNMGLELFHMVRMAYRERMQIISDKTVECPDHRLSVNPFSSGTLDPSSASFQGLQVLLRLLYK